MQGRCELLFKFVYEFCLCFLSFLCFLLCVRVMLGLYYVIYIEANPMKTVAFGTLFIYMH